MTDAPLDPPLEDLKEDDKSVTGARYEEFLDALGALYIPGNMSGRLQFAQAWPQVAAFIMGKDLMHFDIDGAGPSEEREALEDIAEKRQQKLLGIAETLEQRSVKDGVLQEDYVGKVIHAVGRDIALHLYKAAIVDRFLEDSEELQTPGEPQTRPLRPPVPTDPVRERSKPKGEDEEPDIVFPKFEDLKKRIKDIDKS